MEVSNFNSYNNEKKIDNFIPSQVLSGGQTLCIIMRMLLKMNGNFGKISCASAFISSSIFKQGLKDKRLNFKHTILLSLLHSVGSYRFLGEKENSQENLSLQEIEKHYIWAYYYLKNMTPLKEDAKTMLFHNTKYNPESAKKVYQIEYASLIFTALAISKFLIKQNGNYSNEDFSALGLDKFNSEYAMLFKKVNSKNEISQKLANGSYLNELEKEILNLEFNKEETECLFKLMIYIIDFKSTWTVFHTIHTASYAFSIGKLANLSINEANELFTAAILHDLGKAAIPYSILESPGRLSSEEYEIMKTHVKETENILNNIVPEKISFIAVSHHEKLNGQGYPYGLTEKELSVSARILSAADIFSALLDKRSYKEEFSKEKIIEIFDMKALNNEIDTQTASLIKENFEKIQQECIEYTKLYSAPIGTVDIQFNTDFNEEEI